MTLEERIAAIEARQRAHGQHDPNCPAFLFIQNKKRHPDYMEKAWPESACNCWLSSDSMLTRSADGFTTYPLPDGTYACAWGGQWLSGVYGKTPEEAIELGRAEVAKG